MVKVPVLCMTSLKHMNVDDSVLTTVLKKKDKVPLISEELKGVIGMIEPVAGNIRIMIAPHLDDIHTKIDQYTIVPKTGENQEVLFYLTPKVNK